MSEMTDEEKLANYETLKERVSAYPFSIADGRERDWRLSVGANPDSYGGEVMRFAASWAYLMEQRLAADAALTVADVAKQASRDADNNGGITGFMYGCAVGILAHVWARGEELRRWHNLDTQLQDEGERANESGGVLNPAIVNVSMP